MFGTLLRIWKEDRAAIVSAELATVMTCSVLALVVGLKQVSDAVNVELNDLAQAVGSLNQSYGFNGLAGCQAFVSGSSFMDVAEMCECSTLLQVCPTGEMQEHVEAVPEGIAPCPPMDGIPYPVPMPVPMPRPMQDGPLLPEEIILEPTGEAGSI